MLTVAANSLNRTVFCFGYIIGASPLNPNAWTTDKLRAAITEVKTKYPEIAGVMMCKSDVFDACANKCLQFC